MVTSDNAMADTDEKIFIGKGEAPAWLTLALANRHGLVTGATGTGKTVSLQVMAEGFARAGVPVFAADLKGDLSGISEAGEPNSRPDRLDCRDHFRYQCDARQDVDRPGDRAKRDSLGHPSGRRRGCCRSRQEGGRFGRPRPGAGRARRPVAAMKSFFHFAFVATT